MSGAPSPFLLQHAAYEAPRVDDAVFRPFWRIVFRTRLDRLLADGAITDAEYRAAMRFKAAVDHLTGRRHGFERYPLGNGWGSLMRVDAMTQVRRVRERLGPLATWLVWSCVVDDASWATIGARLQVHPKTARAWTIAALQTLASMNRED